MAGETSDQLSLRLTAAPVRDVVRVSVEEELLDPSLGSWSRAFSRRARGPLGVLRGRSRDRLDAAGEAFFDGLLKPRLLFDGVERVRAAQNAGSRVVLESEGSEHVIRPLALHLGADRMACRRFEFRDGIATGRTLPGCAETDAAPRRRVAAAAVLAGGPLPETPLSVERAFHGRELLVIGVTGFIGKVWLASLLEQLPAIRHVHVLLRRRRARTPAERFDRIVRESPVFERLRRAAGADLADLLRRSVTVIEGDVCRPGLGLADDVLHALADRLDLVVNCAGLTEFNPDPRDAVAVNVDATRHVLDFAASCRRAALLHVSTCYVAGLREGRIAENLDAFRTPAAARGFHPEEERARLLETIRHRRTRARGPGPPRPGSPRFARRPAIDAVLARARQLGWPNIYTFTKALGEALIKLHSPPGFRYSIVRPSIVESAIEFPFAGWNEGVNTSAPLSHVLGSYFRQLPVNERKRLDVIPVDLVCRGLTLVAAALLEGRHAPVVQLATSDTNPLDLRRAVELTALAHRRHYRSRPGWRSRILARLEATPVSRERYGKLSVPAQLRFVRAVNRMLGRVTGGRAPLARPERILQRVKELVDLYEPFLLDNEPVFEANRIEQLSASLPPEERERFGYDARSFDWYHYWVDVHIPGLRRWSYPLLEGRPVDARSLSVSSAPGAEVADLAHPAMVRATPPAGES